MLTQSWGNGGAFSWGKNGQYGAVKDIRAAGIYRESNRLKHNFFMKASKRGNGQNRH